MRIILTLLIALTTVVGATAQTGKEYSGEVVMISTGALAAPWKEGRACTQPQACEPIIYNSQTGEIARLGNTWASDFGSSGRGEEVWRKETATAKANRLKDD